MTAETLDTQHGRESGVADLFQDLPVAAALHDLRDPAGALEVNARFTATFGYRASELGNLTGWAKTAYPDEAERKGALDRILASVEAHRRTGRVPPPSEHRVTDKWGRSRTILLGAAAHGPFALFTFQDITEPRRAAEARKIAESSAGHATLTDTTMLGGAFAMLQAPGQDIARFTYVNGSFLDLLGVARKGVLAEPLSAMANFPAEDHARWMARIRDALRRKTPFAMETRLVAPGAPRWVRAEAVPRDLPDGWVIWEGVVVDVTRLKTTEQWLERVLDVTGAYVWSYDIPAGLAVFNERWAREMGLEPVQRSDQWWQATHPEDRPMLQDVLGRLVAGDLASCTVTYRRLNAQGDWVWIKIFVGVSARDAGGKPRSLAGVSFDVTEEQERWLTTQDTLTELRESLAREHQRAAVAEVTGGLAHEINNLLGLVTWNIERLTGMDAADGAVADGLVQLRRAVDMTRDLIEAHRDMPRPDTSDEEQDLGALVAKAVALIGKRRTKCHDLRIKMPDNPVKVRGNPTQILQVVMQLALNARDAGVPERPAKVEISVLAAGTPLPARHPDAGALVRPGVEMALLQISDTGVGISQDVRARMFQNTFAADGARGLSMGMGLPIVARILRFNRASLWIDTEEGAGTTMTVAWPVNAPKADPATANRPQADAAQEDVIEPNLLAGVRALVVDDMPDVAMALAAMLETAGAEAYCETDAVLAQEALSEREAGWSVLVTDLQMPGVDGLTLARHVADLDPAPPVVLVSARTDRLVAGEDMPFARVLSKPVSGSQLVRAVRQAIDAPKQPALSEE
ncbi:MAG: PAS domain-containing protein [Roseicyclus sp.]|uniref:hybrid sensor histidine kinase/response regulator n=1 Tax=Roseicyclus sp. TaxID=1914329 RepID=UPI003A83ED1B